MRDTVLSKNSRPTSQMRLKDPPKTGWSHSKASWHIFIWFVYLVVVAVVVLLYHVVLFMHDFAGLLAFLVPYTLIAIFYSVDFSNKDKPLEGQRSKIKISESRIGNLFAIVWGVGVGFLTGALYSYLVLGKVGLKEPYVSLTAIMSVIVSFLAIGCFLLGQRILNFKQKNKKDLMITSKVV